MLPTAPTPSTRLTVEDYPQPVRSTTPVLDVLSEFVPGQKILAQIQLQLANGAYRATIAQRDVTLALPFSAKPGDSLELEVLETDGKVTFAATRPPEDSDSATPRASAETTLSKTGQLIGNLFREEPSQEKKPVQLNGGQPVLAQPTAPAKENAPTLHQAVKHSGLFYESHQAQWVEGKIAAATLRLDPQASATAGAMANSRNSGQTAAAPDGLPQPPTLIPTSANSPATRSGQVAQPSVGETQPPLIEVHAKPVAEILSAKSNAGPERMTQNTATAASESGSSDLSRIGSRSPTASELLPLVQQQLNSLASNVYSFQALMWPGQPIQWEIVDEDGQRESGEGGDEARPWKTRLKMLLPLLGDINAALRLEGTDLTLRIDASDVRTRETMLAGLGRLQDRMALAGLRLMALDIRPPDADDGLSEAPHQGSHVASGG